MIYAACTLCVCHPLRQTRVDPLLACQHDFVFARQPADRPVKKRRLAAFNSFFSLASVISPFASRVCQIAPAIVPISSFIGIVPSFPNSGFRAPQSHLRLDECNSHFASFAEPWTGAGAGQRRLRRHFRLEDVVAGLLARHCFQPLHEQHSHAFLIFDGEIFAAPRAEPVMLDGVPVGGLLFLLREIVESGKDALARNQNQKCNPGGRISDT